MTMPKFRPKFLMVAAVLLTVSPVALRAYAQTDAMPPETKAPAPMAEPMKAPVPPSHAVNLAFEGKNISVSVGDLLSMPQVTVHVHNAHRGGIEETYSGPLLSDVLEKIGLKASRETQPLILHSVIVATGTDHYYVLYSAAEVEPSFTTSQVIVAVMKAGLPNTEGGGIELINTNGAKPARWVHGLMGVSVLSLAPQ
ncbi:MAG: hypothetical protein WBY53_06165 [Acidobacteriaceae bacterium]